MHLLLQRVYTVNFVPTNRGEVQIDALFEVVKQLNEDIPSLGPLAREDEELAIWRAEDQLRDAVERLAGRLGWEAAG